MRRTLKVSARLTASADTATADKRHVPHEPRHPCAARHERSPEPCQMLGREHQSSAVSPKYTVLPKSGLAFGRVALSGKTASVAIPDQAIEAALRMGSG